MQVLRTGLAALVEPDLIEPGKPVVFTSQDAEVQNDASLVGEDVDIRRPSMAEQTDLYPLARLQVAYPGKLRSDEQVSVVTFVRHRDGKKPPGPAANHVDGDEPPAYEAAQQRRAQQPSDYDVDHALERQLLCAHGSGHLVHG